MAKIELVIHLIYLIDENCDNTTINILNVIGLMRYWISCTRKFYKKKNYTFM